MTESGVLDPPRHLSQFQRIAYTFVSPLETFADVLRDQSWWLPFVLIVLCSYGFSYTAVKRVGVDQIVATTMSTNPQMSQRLAAATPEERSQFVALAKTALKWSMIGAPLLILGFNLVAAAVLLASFKLAFNAQLTYPKVLCLILYADLINSVKPVVGTIMLLARNPSQGFDIQNPVATNLAYFLNLGGNRALGSLLISVDAITIWYLCVMSVGFAVVGKVSRQQAVMVAFGWWAVIVFGRIAWAAISG